MFRIKVAGESYLHSWDRQTGMVKLKSVNGSHSLFEDEEKAQGVINFLNDFNYCSFEIEEVKTEQEKIQENRNMISEWLQTLSPEDLNELAKKLHEGILEE